MKPAELFFLACALSMDAFAVALCKSLAAGGAKARQSLCCGLWFGTFQALMPLIGYLLGARFQAIIEGVDHWIAFVLLSVIGANMLKEAFGQGEAALNAAFTPSAMLPLAVATGIDALAVGVTFACLRVRILPSVLVIGLTTFFLSTLGSGAGTLLGAKWRRRSEAAGGIVLLLIGAKILLEHLFFR